MSTTPAAAASRYDCVQPSSRSDTVMGTAAMTAPSWPSTPVSWVTSGMRRATNQVFTRRSTHTNVIASPMPTKARARSAS